jgi:hypothetical protein
MSAGTGLVSTRIPLESPAEFQSKNRSAEPGGHW